MDHSPARRAPVGASQRRHGRRFQRAEYKIKRFSGMSPHLVGATSPSTAWLLQFIPHGMVQEFLNASDGHLWAIVTNGLQLRLLRDNPALSRMACVEFDLEAMMEDPSLFPDFLIFWHLCHHSRLEHAVPEETWLEKWSQGAIQDGAPVLDKLRVGVEQAVVHLGKGFLEHRANEALREKIRSQELSALEYYRQLLRIIYRLLFLFVSEDRPFFTLPTLPRMPARPRRILFHPPPSRTCRFHAVSPSIFAPAEFASCHGRSRCPLQPACTRFLLWRANPSSTPDLDGPVPAPKDPPYKFPTKLTFCYSIAYLQDDRDKASLVDFHTRYPGLRIRLRIPT